LFRGAVVKKPKETSKVVGGKTNVSPNTPR